jgi:hypothetical protein
VEDLDIPDDCWRAPGGDIARGDLCELLPMAVLVDNRVDGVLVDDNEPATRFVPVRFSHGLVLGVVNGYAVVATVATVGSIPDADEFASLLSRGKTARSYARLPLIPDDEFEAWQGQEGIVFFSHLESFPADEVLVDLRVAAMTERAREVLRERVARLVAEI